MEYLNYSLKYEEEAGWIVEETEFDATSLGKCEAIFTQGNGYLGVRNALEEKYVGEQRGMFVNGTFDRSFNEVPELPNFPDITGTDIFIDGFRFYLERGNFEQYSRQMNYKTGEAVRHVLWTAPNGKRVEFTFRRFVSLSRKHVIAGKIEITPLDKAVKVKIESGLDARVTNTGVQHFKTPESRIFDNKYLQTIAVTGESEVTCVVQAVNILKMAQENLEVRQLPYIRNRRNINIYHMEIKRGSTLCLEKISTIHTSRDRKYAELNKEQAEALVRSDACDELKRAESEGYERLFEESRKEWHNFWKTHDVQIDTDRVFDQLSLRFAVYHLHIMNNADDNRLGVGAKGLSGEEYKGHSFWDTEIFLMPYYLFEEPGAARKLLEYRYKILKGARQKAAKAGYKGAMYPWEAAWIDDEEVCADIIGVDVETGKPMRVLCGEIEIHISADVAYAVWEYYTASQDEEFMEECGYEILLDTARFWASRCQWNKEKERYEILHVIGPDEYKEEVDNDVYTNYMAHFNMKKALEIIKILPEKTYKRLHRLLNLESLQREIETVLKKLYLPVPNKNGIIPQNDTYLSLREINLDKYKNSLSVGTIHHDYSMERLKEVQVSKQGDLVVLLYLMGGLFSDKVIKDNYFYYEKHTTHDSSLSKCTHAILANDLGMEEESYGFYQGAAQTDVGLNKKSSDNGIHSAACGGIWQCVVMGYGGVRIVNGKLRITPHLPKEWRSMRFTVQWQNKVYTIYADHEKTDIKEEETTA